jgi:Xaa-Pro aminopeptidase
MSSHEDRLKALREQLGRDRLDGFVVPLTDEHMSEYVGAYAQRLAWLTGFQGSAGTAVVLPAEAAIFVDGRYTLQVREQVDARHWHYVGVPQTSVATWLEANAPAGARIGYDPWLHTRKWVEEAGAALGRRGAALVPVESNPVDAIWPDRPAPSTAPLAVHEERHTGRAAADKRQDVADWLRDQGADAVVVSALDSLAWLLNIRGTDVARTPVALAYALAHADATVDLFVAPEKLTDDVRRHLGNAVRLHPRHAFAEALAGLGGRTVAVDPERAVAAIFARLDGAGATIRALRDPTVLAKAIKNPVEIAGARAAHHRDGVALTRFLHWAAAALPQGTETELSAAARLEAFRRDTGQLKDLSFDTISGFGPNGAVVHYRVDEGSNRAIAPDGLYLIDSGGQYLDGTTDVTRTIAVGTPTADMRRHFTLVLKGHIAIDSLVFPTGTRGGQIDVLARQFLWSRGLDYAHGTGHGVGSYLSVHEGPQRIATVGNDEPLQAGMIVSNEPGYYRTGDYGIRIENLVLVVPRAIPGAEREMLGFEPLTLAPIDRALIDETMLSDAERGWVDAYHARVLAAIGPELDEAARRWLEGACAPL